MCLAPRVALSAAPPPPPTMQDRTVVAARDAQRRRQRASGGVNATLLTQPIAAPTMGAKTLLGS
jgi:hypothetical protein